MGLHSRSALMNKRKKKKPLLIHHHWAYGHCSTLQQWRRVVRFLQSWFLVYHSDGYMKICCHSNSGKQLPYVYTKGYTALWGRCYAFKENHMGFPGTSGSRTHHDSCRLSEHHYQPGTSFHSFCSFCDSCLRSMLMISSCYSGPLTHWISILLKTSEMEECQL